MAQQKFIVSASPHIATLESTKYIMMDVIIALLPAVIAGWFYFGTRALLVLLVTVVASVLSEYVYQWIYFGIKEKSEAGVSASEAFRRACSRTDVGDLSAVVTGLLLGMNLPVTIPLWMAAVGAVFAIVVVKQLFGGIGQNFVNPALAARAFMLASWPVAMTSFTAPVMSFTRYIQPADAITSATPLSMIKESSQIAVEGMPSLYDAFVGRIGGCIGETATILLIVGGLYLLIRKVIDWRIPVCYLGSFAILTYFFGTESFSLSFVAFSLCTGGIMLGAIFMATDYTTTPTTNMGHIIFGIGCGILTFVIRRFGGYPEGTSYAILLMNVTAPLIDRFVHPKRFGEVKKHA